MRHVKSANTNTMKQVKNVRLTIPLRSSDVGELISKQCLAKGTACSGMTVKSSFHSGASSLVERYMC